MDREEAFNYLSLLILVILSLMSLMSLIGSLGYGWDGTISNWIVKFYRETIRIFFERLFSSETLSDYIGYSLFTMGKASRAVKMLYGISLIEYYRHQKGDIEGPLDLVLSYIFAPIILVGLIIAAFGFLVDRPARGMIVNSSGWPVVLTMWILLLIDGIIIAVLRSFDSA